MAGHTRGPGAAAVGTIVVLLVAVAYAAPLAMCRYFPGLDLPWHAAVIEVLHRGDAGAADFLGYFEIRHQLSSYVTLYHSVDLLAHVTGDVAVALQLVSAAYVIAFVLAARSLLRAFGGSGVLAVLAAPAAYSVTVAFGFLAYALAYPLTMWMWALARTAAVRGATAWRVGGIAALSALIAVTHPFAAAVAVAGGLLVAATSATRDTLARAGAIAAAMIVGLVPAVVAVVTLGGDTEGSGSGQLVHRLGLWDKLSAQQFTSPLEALATAPARLFGYVPEAWRFALAAIALVAAIAARHLGGVPAREGAARDRTVAWLAVGLACAYLITPFTFEWPRRWYGAQPRLLPLLWVALLCLLRVRARPASPRATVAVPVAVAAVALAVFVATAWIPYAAEARDFRAVVTASDERVRTLGLIEQPPARLRHVPSPWRHATAWMLVENGGYVSGLPMARPRAGNAGVLVPVVLANDAPPLPPAPGHGHARTFDFAREGAGWDQILIRDADPEAPFDYFREHADRVELIARRGRWRLYRVRSSGALL